MKLKLAVAALALVIATPTFAAEYYIIQSASSKKCTVASKKPTSDKVTWWATAPPTRPRKRRELPSRSLTPARPDRRLPSGGPGIEPPEIRRPNAPGA